MTSEAPLTFDLKPVDPDNRPLTFAFSISVWGKIEWPLSNEDAAPIEIQLDDLFSHLVEFWRPLLLRQTYPFGLTPLCPSDFARRVAGRWESQPQELVDDEAEVLTAFEDAHDLSRAFGGVYDLPHFWMLRDGNHMICDTGRNFWRLSFNEVVDELTRVGDWIASYFMCIAPEKWDRVVYAWQRRDQVSEVDLVAWSASIDTQVAEELLDRGVIKAPASLSEAVNDNDPLLIAARMAGELPTDQIVRIIEIAKSFGGRNAQGLDELSTYCHNVLSRLPKSIAPHSQGETIARELREYLKIPPSVPIDIFAFVAGLGVEIKCEAVEPSTFDGLAVAGGHYGPGAFINKTSRRLGREPGDLTINGGARVTLAHELCHLLLDRKHPLSAVEVLRSRMPTAVEARARAFAGEFLLPTWAAFNSWQVAGAPLNEMHLHNLLQELVDKFGVTFSVAAWKVEHGAGPSQHQLRAALDTIAPYR